MSNLIDTIMTTRVYLIDVILYGLLALLVLAAIITFIRDEPLAYYWRGGKYYRLGFRTGEREVESDDN